jgi:hypothetical protein
MKLTLRKNVSNTLLILLLLFLATPGLLAQQTISGTVTDAADGQGIPFFE